MLCKRGHVVVRTNDGDCKECVRERQRTKESKIYAMWWQARRTAQRDGLPFNITEAHLRKIWPEDNRCPIMLTEFQWPMGASRRGPLPSSPSIDRIIPSKGYVRGNVAIISSRANTLKNDCTDPQVFIRLANWLGQYQVTT